MFVGFEVIGKLAPTLHNALIAGMAALCGIALVGALYAARFTSPDLGRWLGAGAAGLAALNLVAGLVLSSRLLASTQKRERG
jgi:NAD(P) transhydrogenase subunit alpha